MKDNKITITKEQLDEIVNKKVFEELDALEQEERYEKENFKKISGWRRVMINDLIKLFGMSKDNQMTLIYLILNKRDSLNKFTFNNMQHIADMHNEIYATKNQKKKISRQWVSKQIKYLKEIQLIKQTEIKNQFIINPILISPFSKSKQLELIVEYNFVNSSKQLEIKIEKK